MEKSDKWFLISGIIGIISCIIGGIFAIIAQYSNSTVCEIFSDILLGISLISISIMAASLLIWIIKCD